MHSTSSTTDHENGLLCPEALIPGCFEDINSASAFPDNQQLFNQFGSIRNIGIIITVPPGFQLPAYIGIIIQPDGHMIKILFVSRDLNLQVNGEASIYFHRMFSCIVPQIFRQRPPEYIWHRPRLRHNNFF